MLPNSEEGLFITSIIVLSTVDLIVLCKSSGIGGAGMNGIGGTVGNGVNVVAIVLMRKRIGGIIRLSFYRLGSCSSCGCSFKRINNLSCLSGLTILEELILKVTNYGILLSNNIFSM